jgi:adenine-specific DNA-methyltransferase
MGVVSKKNLVKTKNSLDHKSKVPHIIKYMGSKRELIDFLADSMNEIYEGEPICDLFAGTSILSGALGHKTTMYSNDIQSYSAS